MAILPWEIVIDILHRLPVKDLLRYRSVAKPWRSLIDSPNFIKIHLTHSLKNTTTSKSNLSVFLKSPQGLHIFDLDSLDPAAQPLSLPPIAADAAEIEVLGCRNGLVALEGSAGNMALWNPSTRKHRKLPFTEIRDFREDGDHVEVVFRYGATGFGYDPVHDDHKLLRAVHYCETPSFPEITDVRVYSANSKSWKTVRGFPTQYYLFRDIGVSVGSSLNWMGCLEKGKGACLIVGFDLSTEESREISIPDDKGEAFYLKLGELRGCLCLERSVNGDLYSKRVEVWIMKEYGVKESWTQLFSVVPSRPIRNFTYAIPVVYLNGTDQVLVDIAGQKFVLYDVEKNRAKNFRVSGLPRDFQAQFCVQSLVGVDGGGNERGTEKRAMAEEDRKKKTKQKIGKKRDDFLSKGFKLVL